MGAKECCPSLIINEYFLKKRLQSPDILYEGSKKVEA